MAEAEEEAQSKKPLVEIFAEFPKLAGAWRRGRYLRRLRGLAASAATIQEAATSLEITEAELADSMETDAEVRDVWNEARISTVVSVKAALIRAANKGKASAVTHVLAAMRRDLAAPRVGFNRLQVNQLAEAIGRTRQTIHAWWSKEGCPRNADGTYNLSEVWQWCESRAVKAQPARGGVPSDPLRDLKAEKIRQELQVHRGELLDRNAVIAGLLTRWQTVVSAFDRKPRELAVILNGQDARTIETSLRDCFSEIRRELCTIPDELHLTPEQGERLAGLLTDLTTSEEAA